MPCIGEGIRKEGVGGVFEGGKEKGKRKNYNLILKAAETYIYKEVHAYKPSTREAEVR